MTDTQSKKYLLTVNNPAEKGLDHETLKQILGQLKSCVYWCMADEIGLDTHTPHTHIFIAMKSPVRFSTIRKRFPEAHADQARGTARECRDYVAKTGKWAEDPKSDTSVEETYEEWGTMPLELGQGARTDIAEIYRQIDEGMTNAEIMAANPDAAMHIGKMDKIRQDILEARYRDQWRDLDVTYVWGPTATGKTRGVLEKHGYANCYRVTDYKHPFDLYMQNPVIVFDEYRSNLLIGDMLDYLDGYPISLSCRYANRVACYETVYIISNIDLRAQYQSVQENEPETWKAFLRRIHHVIEYRYGGEPIDHGTALEYIYPTTPQIWRELPNDDGQETLPF